MDSATSPPTKARHAERNRRGVVEYPGPVGREQHMLGDDGDEDEAPADSAARKARRIRLGRKP